MWASSPTNINDGVCVGGSPNRPATYNKSLPIPDSVNRALGGDTLYGQEACDKGDKYAHRQ